LRDPGIVEFAQRGADGRFEMTEVGALDGDMAVVMVFDPLGDSGRLTS
jgi:hypothetical protein